MLDARYISIIILSEMKKDIFYFKEKGFKIYDFGGFAKDTNDESLKGINNYKLLFGGKVVPCTDYYSYNYWLLKKIAKIIRAAHKKLQVKTA